MASLLAWHDLRRLVLVAAIGAALAGCSAQNRPAATLVQSPPFDFPPREMADDVKKIVGDAPISLTCQDEAPGQIVTDWQPFRGEFHIARFWYERTRYHITVVPDFNDPAHHSRIQVVDETQQRPEEGGLNKQAEQWSPAPDLHRPDRAQAILQQIENQLGIVRRSL